MSLWRFVVYIKDELFLALGTASTEVVLPRIVDELMYAGCSPTTTGLVVPTGYSFNLDGATLYLSICVLFLAQALGVDLSLGEQVTAVLVLMRCLRRWRRSDHGLDAGDVNLLGNCVATMVVARWEGQLDADRMRKVLRGHVIESLGDPPVEDRKEPVASAS